MFTIERAENANEIEREGRNGRIYTSSRPRVVWIVRDRSHEIVETFDKRRDAKEFVARRTKEISNPSTYNVEVKHPTDFYVGVHVVTVTRNVFSRRCSADGFGMSRECSTFSARNDIDAIRAFLFEHGCRVVSAQEQTA